MKTIACLKDFVHGCSLAHNHSLASHEFTKFFQR